MSKPTIPHWTPQSEISREQYKALKESRDKTAQDAAKLLQYYINQFEVEGAALAWACLSCLGITIYTEQQTEALPANSMMIAPKNRETAKFMRNVATRAEIMTNSDLDPTAVLFSLVSELRDKFEELHAKQIRTKRID